MTDFSAATLTVAMQKPCKAQAPTRLAASSPTCIPPVSAADGSLFIVAGTTPAQLHVHAAIVTKVMKRGDMEKFFWHSKRPPLIRSYSVPTIMPSDYEDESGPIPPIGQFEYAENSLGCRATGYLGFVEKVEDVIILEDETAIFACKVQHLWTTCQWYKNRTLLVPDERTAIIEEGDGWHRLELKNVTFNDQGIYSIECRYNNSYITSKGHLFVAPRNIRDGVYYHKKPFIKPGVKKHLRNTKVYVGEEITLKAKFSCKSQHSIWYKNNHIIEPDPRIVTIANGINASITISNADPTDTGLYFVIAITKQGLVSSFADVEVGTTEENRILLPYIEEFLPEEIEALVGEETRLVLKVHIDRYTHIKWEQNNREIRSEDFVMIDYGNNYIGLNLLNPVLSSVGEYKITLSNTMTRRTVSTDTRLDVNLPPIPPPEVLLVRPLETAVACCGAQVSFDCSFELENPIYFYVVWYIGHYKVERTNSLFNVICSGSQFLLYIKKVEPTMAGEVICELRRSSSNRKSVVMQRTHAHLVIVPQSTIIGLKSNETCESKLYYESESAVVPIRVEEYNFDRLPPSAPPFKDDPDFVLKIAFCSLDKQGLYFAHITRGVNSALDTVVQIAHCPDTNGRIVVVNWDYDIVASESWFGIEVAQVNGSFASAGITSCASFQFENRVGERMLIFRITAVNPLPDAVDAEIFIVPPPEIVLRPLVTQTIQQLVDFEEKYMKSDDIIGAGAFGSVVIVRDKTDGKEYAAKFVKLKVGRNREQTMREYYIMRQLRHPKLIELIDFYESRNFFVFVMEYCWGGELFDRVAGEEYLQEMDVVGYVRQICEALEYLHGCFIVHLDLKPENIICLSPNSRQVKLIDFGLARNVNEDFSRAFYGTRDYIAPEVIDFDPITTASDMWSLGVVTYTLLSGLMPFAGENWVQRSVNISRVNFDYNDYIFKDVSILAKQFINRLLLRRADCRLTASEALEHDWIKFGPPQGMRPKHMNKMRENLKSYLADYRSRWQRAGNVMIAAHRLRMRARVQIHPDPTPNLF